MPLSVLIVDGFGAILAVAGFAMAFRQRFVRGLFGQPPKPPAPSRSDHDDPAPDPLTYILRIAGVMMMGFGIVLAGMVTLYHLA
ncbi:MAG: hypothetical protein B7Z20_03720 [Sphingobium sp. 32-64-5]|nr:MAG: hypothetical protein B7Z20_03720 [Sphingobium sp. 32-64-5]